jgi:predicted enzyme related to lactoylglutathione lyase
MIDKIAYTWYPTTDMDRAVEFYQGILGFKLLFKGEDWSEFEIDGQRLALCKVDTLHQGRTSPGVSFMAQPIEIIIDTLSSKGVTFIEELKVYPYGKLVHFQDPDGNILGLYEPPPKSNQS